MAVHGAVAPQQPEKVLKIRYPLMPVERVYKYQFAHAMELIQLVLENSGTPVELIPVTVKTTSVERLTKMLLDDEIDYVLRHTHADLEKRLTPIRYPVYRGLIGWRIFAINKTQQATFKAVESLEQLKALKLGVGYNWPDSEILKPQNFNLREGRSTSHLYTLLSLDRIDYFPRGLYEIGPELESISETDIVAEQHLALVYPSATYYFVAPDNHKLETVLKQGFENCIKSGAYQAIFMKYFGSYLHDSKLQQRKIFRIQNPNISPLTPMNRKVLWFTPEELSSGNHY